MEKYQQGENSVLIFQKLLYLSITKTEKKHIVRKAHLAAKYVSEHPETFSQIGIIFISTDQILMNSLIFAGFINEKQNSLLKTLKLSNFELKRTTADIRNALSRQFPILKPQIQQFTKSLSILRCKDPYFRIDSSVKDLEQIKFRKKNSNNNNQNSSIFLDTLTFMNSEPRHDFSDRDSMDELPDFMDCDERNLYLDAFDDLFFVNESEI